MTALVDTMMEQGALGVSTALLYAPAIYAPTEELVAWRKPRRAPRGIYASHIRKRGRSRGRGPRRGVRVGREASIPVEVCTSRCRAAALGPDAARPGQDRLGSGGRLDVTQTSTPTIAAATSLDGVDSAVGTLRGMDSLIAPAEDPPTCARHSPGRCCAPPWATRAPTRTRGRRRHPDRRPFQDSCTTRRWRSRDRPRAPRRPDQTLFDIVIADHSRTGRSISR